MEYLTAAEAATTDAEKVAIVEREEEKKLQEFIAGIPSVRWLHCSASPLLELGYATYRVSDMIACAYMAALEFVMARYSPRRFA